MGIRKISEPNFIQKTVMNGWFWLLFCSFLFTYPIIRSMNRILPEGPSVIHNLPAYSLMDENNKSFGSNDLKGKAYLANFFFTSCQTICLDLMEQMKKIQKRVRGLGTNVALVSFTVDPEEDDPGTLFKYARKLRANPHVWKFLTGSQKQLQSLLVDGFKVPMGEKEETAKDVWDVAHSSRIVLVDALGGVLGYYSTEKDDINRLMIDLGLLVNKDKLNFKKKEKEG